MWKARTLPGFGKRKRRAAERAPFADATGLAFGFPLRLALCLFRGLLGFLRFLFGRLHDLGLFGLALFLLLDRRAGEQARDRGLEFRSALGKRRFLLCHDNTSLLIGGVRRIGSRAKDSIRAILVHGKTARREPEQKAR